MVKKLSDSQSQKLRQAVLANVGHGVRGRRVNGVTIPAAELVKGVEESHAFVMLKQLVKEGEVEQRELNGGDGWRMTYRLAR